MYYSRSSCYTYHFWDEADDNDLRMTSKWIILDLFISCCCCWVASVVSDSAWPHRRQPTRLPRPWGSPGKNTGVGCHFLLQCMKVKSESEVAQSCLTQRPLGLQPTRFLHPWDFPGKSTGVCCPCLLQFIKPFNKSHFHQWLCLKYLIEN